MSTSHGGESTSRPVAYSSSNVGQESGSRRRRRRNGSVLSLGPQAVATVVMVMTSMVPGETQTVVTV